ncbi:MAG: hypothetical protein GY765_36615 [bacterium]|nr:hypothetical protein [bacterium]
MDKRLKILIGFLVLLLVLTIPAAAGDDGHDTHAKDDSGHHFSWTAFFGKVLNSTILFGGLIFFLRKPLINLLAQKSIEIKDDIQQREELVKSTSQQLETIKKRLTDIEDEVRTIKDTAAKSGKEEKERIEELGKKEAQRIVEITNEEVDNKVGTAVRNLKEKIAEMTIDHFKKDIQAHMDKKTHEKIIEKNIDISGDIIERK